MYKLINRKNIYILFSVAAIPGFVFLTLYEFAYLVFAVTDSDHLPTTGEYVITVLITVIKLIIILSLNKLMKGNYMKKAVFAIVLFVDCIWTFLLCGWLFSSLTSLTSFEKVFEQYWMLCLANATVFNVLIVVICIKNIFFKERKI